MLERNELVALVNLLHRLALGVEVVRDLSLRLAAGAAAGGGPPPAGGLGAIQQVTHGGPLPEGLRGDDGSGSGGGGGDGGGGGGAQ